MLRSAAVVNQVPFTVEPLKMALKGPKHVRKYKHCFICIKLAYVGWFVHSKFYRNAADEVKNELQQDPEGIIK
jgi:hypothetical protein